MKPTTEREVVAELRGLTGQMECMRAGRREIEEERDAEHQRAERSEAERDALREALEKLRNECSGVVGVYDSALHDLIGTTNYSVLLQRIGEADKALAGQPAGQPKKLYPAPGTIVATGFVADRPIEPSECTGGGGFGSCRDGRDDELCPICEESAGPSDTDPWTWLDREGWSLEQYGPKMWCCWLDHQGVTDVQPGPWEFKANNPKAAVLGAMAMRAGKEPPAAKPSDTELLAKLWNIMRDGNPVLEIVLMVNHDTNVISCRITNDDNGRELGRGPDLHAAIVAATQPTEETDAGKAD